MKLAGSKVIDRLREALLEEGYSPGRVDRLTNWGSLSTGQARQQEEELRERRRSRWLAARAAAGETPEETAQLDQAWAEACVAVPDKSMAA